MCVCVCVRGMKQWIDRSYVIIVSHYFKSHVRRDGGEKIRIGDEKYRARKKKVE